MEYDTSPGFLFCTKVYTDLTFKALIFFSIVGFIVSPLWKLIIDNYNYFHYPLMGLIFVFGLIISLMLFGLVLWILKMLLPPYTKK